MSPRRKTVLGLLALLLSNGDTLATSQAKPSEPSEIHAHLQRGEAYLKANDLTSAKKEYALVLTREPKNAEALADLGVIAFFEKDYPEALKNLRKVLHINPSLEKAQALLGICLERMSDPAARATLETSFHKLTDKSLRVQVGVVLAGLYEREGDLDATASVMRSLVTLEPENPDILYAAQRIYTELADDTLNKLAIVAPSSARMQQVIAERLINEGDLANAIEHYRKALAINPRLPGVHFELAEALLQQAPNDATAQADSEAELDAAVKSEGASAKTACLNARIAYLRGDLTSAYRNYLRAFELNAGSVEAQVGLGRLLSAQDKPQEASRYLQMAVEEDPLNEEAHYRLAMVYRKLGKKDDAEKEFRLFQEIKETKLRVKELYRQMNKKQPFTEDPSSDARP